jgi:hypothetical protein
MNPKTRGGLADSGNHFPDHAVYSTSPRLTTLLITGACVPKSQAVIGTPPMAKCSLLAPVAQLV